MVEETVEARWTGADEIVAASNAMHRLMLWTHARHVRLTRADVPTSQRPPPLSTEDARGTEQKNERMKASFMGVRKS